MTNTDNSQRHDNTTTLLHWQNHDTFDWKHFDNFMQFIDNFSALFDIMYYVLKFTEIKLKIYISIHITFTRNSLILN